MTSSTTDGSDSVRADGRAAEVTVRELAPDAFATVAQWLSDPELNRFLTAQWRGRKVDATTIAVAVRNKSNRLHLVEHAGVPCGLVAFSQFEQADNSAMVWYVLGDRSLDGRGVTTRAVHELCRRGFAEMGLACIWAMVLAPNAASMRVLEKVGFKPAGVMRRVECVEGAQVDRHHFDLLPEELRPV
jgi:RimJ/RimL family protein N-acetyltransferase